MQSVLQLTNKQTASLLQ